MSDHQERERIQRLRDQQIKARDPGPRIKVEWKGESDRKKQEPALKMIFGVLPAKAKGGLIGMAIGLVVSLVMGVLMPEPWGSVCGAIVFWLRSASGSS
jgi:hypothetical protein